MQHDARWLKAIDKRHSTRNYNGQPVEPEGLAALEEVCNTASPSHSVRAVLVRSAGEGVFKGLVGSYGKIRNNPAYVAFVGKAKAGDVQEMIGYLGEMVILEATALGLSTCWIGGFFRQGAAAREVGIAEDEEIYALTPVGYSLEKDTFEEKFMRGFKTKRKRKPMAAITDGLPQELWPAWVSAGLEAARLAPSAINRQPWQFTVENQQVILSTDGRRNLVGPSRRLDCGIAMLHFELGANSCGVELARELLQSPHVARFTLRKK